MLYTGMKTNDDDSTAMSGLACDDEDNIVVCGSGSNNIQQISSGGRKADTILSSLDGLKEPFFIAFRKSNFNIVTVYGDNILAFKMRN